jgi:hypothetical protein
LGDKWGRATVHAITAWEALFDHMDIRKPVAGAALAVLIIGGHTLSHGVTYGIITEDNPLHIKTANCPYISEISGDTISLVGKCAWTDGEDDIFTEWHTTFPASKGVADGAQTFTGGSGKFSGIQGSNPFQCRLAGKEGQFLCTQSWIYELAK